MKRIFLATVLAGGLLFSVCAFAAKGGIPGAPGGETASNNLSFPVIWAEGVTKDIPGQPDMDPVTNGAWYYWWGTYGTDPDIVPLSCQPDPDDTTYCDDGIPGQFTGDLPGAGWVKAYLQKDPGNEWQATNWSGEDAQVDVDWIDWGDNLESVDWYTKSQVRTEVVLYKDLDTAVTEYQMRHVDGWGISEVHGLSVDQSGIVELGAGTQATVYSPCARLTIQKLLIPREEFEPGDLVWDETLKEWTGIVDGLVNPPIFNLPIYEGGDGPGYYSAEVNVKGKVIYGYTWNVRQLNDFTENGGEADGDYRITFSFDGTCGAETLNTSIETAEIMVPEEEVVILEEPGGGGVAAIEGNLTYIDVRILERTGSGSGGGNAGGGGNGGGKGPK